MQALVASPLVRWKWTEKFEENATMCSADFGAGSKNATTVSTFSGKFCAAATLAAIWFLLLLRGACPEFFDMVNVSGHSLCSME